MFRTVRLPIIRSLFTLHSAVVYVIQFCRQLSRRTRMEMMEMLFHPGRQLSSRTRMELQFHPGPARKLSINVYDNTRYTIAECTVNKFLVMDRRTVRNVTK